MKKNKKIRVAMIAPVFCNNGGPEVMVQNLTNALFEKGINITLFAPADWKTKARHITTLKQSLRRRKDFRKLTKQMRVSFINSSQIKVLNYQKNFDIIHLHLQSHAYAVCTNIKKPCVLSFHSPINELGLSMIKSAGIATVALSKAQRGKNRTLAVIHNGVPVNKIKPSFKKGKYLISIGRLHEQKGIDRAIKIALRAKKKLLIFGRMEVSERGHWYYSKKIAPYIDGKKIVLMKEVPNNKIFNYLRNAEALIFPIKKPEVFGMVVAEALACGTPVIGTKINPLPENLRSNKVAFLSNNLSNLVKAAKNIEQFDRKKCREYAEKYFDSLKMADGYIKLYNRILSH